MVAVVVSLVVGLSVIVTSLVGGLQIAQEDFIWSSGVVLHFLGKLLFIMFSIAFNGSLVVLVVVLVVVFVKACKTEVKHKKS